MNVKIDTVSARGRLQARRDPYWQRISKGLYVGFRKMHDGASGTWLLRYRDESGTQVHHTLGPLENQAAATRFDYACAAAQQWILELKHQRQHQYHTKTYKVLDACADYVAHIKAIKGERAASDLEMRYRRWVSRSSIRDIELSALTREHVQAFREEINQSPLTNGPNKGTRTRSKDTVNRDIAAIRAAFNMALADGKISSDFAWKRPLAAYKNVTRRRSIYLDREQRKRLIQFLPKDLALFVYGLSVLPLRPGALALARVADFDERLNVLTLWIDKSGGGRKVKLPTLIADVLRQAAMNRPSTEPLFARDDGTAWNKDAWKKILKRASAAADLPPTTVAYALRHSAITDLVHGGLDLLTVAQISGTSVAMIEKHYGHLRGDTATSALEKLIL
jgi:integrase